MTIIERTKVQAALNRALQLHPDRSAAVSATAAALCLPMEAVADCLPGCCEQADREGVTVCAGCASASRGYSPAMSPVREEEGADSEGGELDVVS